MARAQPHPAESRIELTSRLKLESRCVRSDAYDRAAFAHLLSQDPGLRRCRHHGELLLRTFPLLLSDIFCLLFKLKPVLVERTKVRPALQINRYLLASLIHDPEVECLRGKTALDEEAAGTATLAVAANVMDRLAGKRLAKENLLFELERGIDPDGEVKEVPGGCSPGAEPLAGVPGASEGDSAAGELSYDLQHRLEMAETLRSYQGFERLLSLVDRLTSRLEVDDPTRWQSPEVYDIGQGNELSRLLPGELIGLRASGFKRDFLRRLVEGTLLNYRIEDRHFRGPLALLVDASDSMAGKKEVASKALAIALWQVAVERGQQTSTIVFGPRTAPMWETGFSAEKPTRRQVVALAEAFLGGGTDFERPILAAIDALCRKTESGGQIILISDGLCELRNEWVRRVLTLKTRRRLRIVTLLVDLERSSPHSAALFSDQVMRWSELTPR